MKFNLLYKYTLIFIFSQAVLMYALSFFHTYSVESYNKMYIKDAKVKYNSTINTFKVLTDNFYDTHAKFIAFNMSKINDANESKKALIRENILVKLSNFYSNEKLRNMEVLHILEKDGRSFVRFHQEDKFGDYINLKRPSIDMLRRTFSSQIGIEIGKYKESLRFQFPLFYNGNFVGLYEYGIAYDEIAKEMKKILGGQYYYLIKKSAIDKMVDNSVISKRYKISTIDKQYYELKSFSTNETINSLVEKLSKEKLITKNIEEEKTFASTLNLNNHPYTAVFLSIKDIFGKHISYYIIFEEGNYLKNLYTQLWSFYILFTLISIIILNKLFQTIKNTRFIETILDSQRDMIFFTDGKKMEQANQSILDFFNYPDLKSFTKEHDCVCDFFISEDGYLQKRMGSESWLNYVKNNKIKHKVKLFDIVMQEYKIFELQYKKFKGTNKAIITFHDITQDEKIKQKLEYDVGHDTLTKIYNRSFFNDNLRNILSDAQRYNTPFSLIMFDIDHFKNVNDTYGHSVGDSILMELSALIQSKIRQGDIFARWGGEEFMIIVKTDIKSTINFAQKLRIMIEENKFKEVKTITCSFGVSRFVKGDTFQSITQRCDALLYFAKKNGRNRVESSHEF